MARTKVLRQNVNPIEIGRYYLKSEIGTIIDKAEDIPEFWTATEKSLEAKSDLQVWSLLEAFSGAYRLNGVFSWLSSNAYTWNLEEWNIESVELTKVDPAVNKILNRVNFNLDKFTDYLTTYFKKNPNSDPKGLNEFRNCHEKKIRYKTVIGWEEEGRLKLLDGIHRAVTLWLQGEKTVKVYVARGTSTKESETKLVASYPIYVLWWLARKSYEEKKDVFDAVVKILRELRGRFRNTDEIVKECLKHQPDDEATKKMVKSVLIQ